MFVLAVAIVSPAHALLATASAYYLGVGSTYYFLRSQKQKYAIGIRGLATLLLALSPFISMIASAFHNVDSIGELSLTFSSKFHL